MQVLDLIKQVKREYEEKEGPCTYEPMGTGADKTCLNRWLVSLGDEKLLRKFSGVVLWQYKTFINVHYSSYYRAVDENGNPVAYKDFFKVYDGLYMECRGVVIDVEKEEVVLLPFRKFMNLGECEDTSLENVRKRLEKAEVVEFSDKLDGSMISAGFYENEAVVSGSSCNDPERSPQLKRSMDIISGSEAYRKMLRENEEDTHIFEYVSSVYDPHVVKYGNYEDLFLTGIRNKKTGKEASYGEVAKRAEKYGIKAPEIFSLTFDEVLSSLGEKKASEAEGFVMNVDGFKVKIKYDDYLCVHRLFSSVISPGRVISALADGTFDDLLAKAPDSYGEELLGYRDRISAILEKMEEKVEEYYEKISTFPKKDAMIYINENVPEKYKGFVRNRYLGKEVSYLKSPAGHYRTFEELEAFI